MVLAAALAIVAAAPAQQAIPIPAFHRVDDHVWRGSQPGDGGLRALAANGVKTVIDLRADQQRTTEEKREADALKIQYVNIPLNGYRAPSGAEIAKALAILNDQNAWPVFVHCKRGVDRTGTVIACYRIQHDGWDNAKALDEAKSDGMHPWEFGMREFIREYKAPSVRAK